MSGQDFSVDAQRRMFQEAQERERQAAENKKASRKIRAATAGAHGGVALSGMMAALDAGEDEKKKGYGDDDDDSLGDDWSLGSEESFYVGIERADYAQPNNLEMYGEGKEDDVVKEDRLGISRVSVNIVNREASSGAGGLDWDAEIPIHEDKTSSLYEFMNGPSGDVHPVPHKKDAVVAHPIVGTSLEWDEGKKLGDDDDAVDQVYEHKAAEGKAFIDKLVGATPGKESFGDVGGPATPGPGAGGAYPTLSPMMLFSPGLTPKAAEGEDNGVRQMRERELKKAAAADADAKLEKMKAVIEKNTAKGKVEAIVLMKQLERMMKE